MATKDKINLIIIDRGERRTRSFGYETLFFGRHEKNDVVLSDPKISGVHCAIKRSRNGILLQDQQSKNGTFFNGKRIESAEVTLGDYISIGDSVIKPVPAETVNAIPDIEETNPDEFSTEEPFPVDTTHTESDTHKEPADQGEVEDIPWYHRDYQPTNKDCFVALSIFIIVCLIGYINLRFDSTNQSVSDNQNLETEQQTSVASTDNTTEYNYDEPIDEPEQSKDNNPNEQAELDDDFLDNKGVIQEDNGTSDPVNEDKNKEQLQEEIENLRSKLNDDRDRSKEDQLSTKQLSSDIRPSTVAVIAYEDGEKQGHASGFFIESGKIVTVKHVLKGGTILEVQTLDGKTYPAEISEYHQNRDLIKLHADIPDEKVKPINLSGSIGETGERVLIVGSPGSTKLRGSVSSGIISSVRTADGKKFIQMDISVSKGNSGSPVVNRDGNVVGVLRLKTRDLEEISFGIPASEITATEKWKKGRVALDRAKKKLTDDLRRVERAIKNDNYSKARSILKKFKENGKASGELYAYLGMCNVMLGNYSEAKGNFKIASTIYEHQTWLVHYGFGVCYLKEKNYESAIYQFKKAVKKDASSKYTWSMLGFAYIQDSKTSIVNHDEEITAVIKILERFGYDKRANELRQYGNIR